MGWIGRWLEPLGIHVANTQLGVFLALTFIGLPFIVRTVQPVLEDLDPELEEAAASLGAHRLTAERLGRKGGDEPLGGGGHGDTHRRAAFTQAANQVERLVGRDAAADDQ